MDVNELFQLYEGLSALQKTEQAISQKRDTYRRKIKKYNQLIQTENKNHDKICKEMFNLKRLIIQANRERINSLPLYMVAKNDWKVCMLKLLNTKEDQKNFDSVKKPTEEQLVWHFDTLMNLI